MKYLKIGIYEIGAIAIIAMAAVWRLVLITQGWPLTNSDEATIGIMARHIAYNGEHPVFFYGQNYMGALQAYIGAALFPIFGASLWTVRFGLLLLFILFLFSTYFLTSLLYSKPLAVVTILWLGVGSSYVMGRQLSAIGGYPETLLFGSLAFLCACWLVLTYTSGLPLRKQGGRLLVYACWGLVVGLGLWSDLLIIPFVLLSGLLLLVFCWRELLHILALISAFAGLVLGASPLVLYNLNAPPGEDSFTKLWLLEHGGSSHITYTLALLSKELAGTVQVSIPMMTGNPFCPVTELAFLGPSSPHTFSCTLIHSSWGIGYLLLFAISLLMTVWCAWRVWPQFKNRAAGTDAQPFVRSIARLFLLLAAALALALYAFSAAPIDWPGIHARYIIGLLIATPVILWPLYASVSRFKRQASLLIKVSAALSSIVLVCIACVALIGTLLVWQEVPAIQASNQRDQDLINQLLHVGITHMYTDYWTCDKLAFQSNERIICGVVDSNLQPSHNRDSYYYTVVSGDPHSAYVFPIGSSQLANMENRHRQKDGVSTILARQFSVDGYVVYQP